MKKLLILLNFIAIQAIAMPLDTDYATDLNNYYGYTHYSEDKINKHNNINSSINMYGNLSFKHNEQYTTSLIGYFMYDTAKEIENYNQGKWGEEIYALFETPYGNFTVGQDYNVAYNLAVGAPNIGRWSSNNTDLANFLTTKNWHKKGSNMSYKTLNSVYINTDGASPKLNYTTPSYYGVKVGGSYVPKTYSQTGLVSKNSPYKDDEAYILGTYGSWNISGYELETSIGFADFHNNNKEYTVGASLYRKGWTLGGGYRKSQKEKTEIHENFSDSYRDGSAYNVGISYEIGPLTTGLTYFDSKSENHKYYDKIISFTNSYEYNKYTTISLTTAHLQTKSNTEKNKGYAFILGLELSL